MKSRSVTGAAAYHRRPAHLRSPIDELGFSLTEVRTLLRLGGPEKASCREVRKIATHDLNGIRAKITDLRKLERLLARTVARCSGTKAPEWVCSIFGERANFALWHASGARSLRGRSLLQTERSKPNNRPDVGSSRRRRKSPDALRGGVWRHRGPAGLAVAPNGTVNPFRLMTDSRRGGAPAHKHQQPRLSLQQESVLGCLIVSKSVGALSGMLIRLTKAWRWRAAAIVAVLYAVCVLAPTTVMAFGDSSRAAHCLTENHHAIGKQSHHSTGAAMDAAHPHDDGVAHKHSDPDKTSSKKGNNGDCCGLMCLFAMPGSVAADTDFVRPLAPLAAVKPSLGSVDPGLLFKPPKS